jgi:outer membrane protein
MKILKLVTCILLWASPVYAVSLSDLQESALANRKIIEKYEANLLKSGESVVLAKSSYYPSFDVSYTMNRLDHNSINENENNSLAHGVISLNLFAGFSHKYNIKAAELKRDADSYYYKAIKQDIQLKVALRYLAIFNSRANLKVSQDSHTTISKMYQDAVNRFDVGLIKKNDLLKFKVDLDNAVFLLKKAQVTEHRNLKLLEREVDQAVSYDELEFTEFKQLPPLPDYKQSEKNMFAERSELKALDDLIKASQMQEKVEYASRYPSVDLTNSLLRYDDSLINNNSGTNSAEYRARLVLSMNLFDGYSKRARLNSARLTTKALRYDLVEFKRDLQTELQVLFMNYEINAENAKVALNSIEQAEENLRVDRLSYQEGVSTETDLLTAISNLSRARFNYVAAKSEVFGNYYRITRAVDGF